jgi:DHA1 family inner membrane transport protein
MLSALASNYSILMTGRILSSLTHGTLFGIGSVVAARLVRPDRQASAIAMMFVGVTLANILGVPLGTFIGQHFGWRATFWVVSALGLSALIAMQLFIPKLSNDEQPSFRQEFMVFRRPQVWLTLLMTIVGFGGLFTLYTYIAPLATQTAHYSSEAITYLTLLFGVGITVGNIFGGKWTDRWLMPTLIGMLILMTMTLAAFSLLSQFQIATVILVFLLGFASFGTVPAFQMRVLEKAEGAPNLASSLNIGAFNLGNAGGAWIGGLVIDHGWGYQSLGWVAAVITLVGLSITLLGQALDRQQS